MRIILGDFFLWNYYCRSFASGLSLHLIKFLARADESNSCFSTHCIVVWVYEMQRRSRHSWSYNESRGASWSVSYFKENADVNLEAPTVRYGRLCNHTKILCQTAYGSKIYALRHHSTLKAGPVRPDKNLWTDEAVVDRIQECLPPSTPTQWLIATVNI